MMRNALLTVFLFCSVCQVIGQDVFMTRSGQVTFFSATPMENIEGVNNEVNSLINTKSGEVVFAILVKSFRFEKALMEEHFNENYLESSKIPKATFQGKITNLGAVNFKKNGVYQANVEGDLTIHGVKKHITTSGTITVDGEKFSVVSAFSILLKDYDIERPSLVAEKIAEKIDIKINCRYEPKG